MIDYRQRFAALVAVDRLPVRAELPDPKTDGATATIRLYDPIDSYGDSWGVSAKEFVKVLDDLPSSIEEIRLLINSPGGEVWEGLAILNALRSHKARVVAVVEGIAASAASFIAAGCDELVMAPNSELFVHKAWGLCVGNAGDMQKMADDLLHEDRNLASIYAAKAGGDVETWLTAMAEEKWYSAEEAVDVGLADRVDAQRTAEQATSAKARHDLSIFAAIRSTQILSATLPSPTPSTGEEGGPIVDLSELREALGLAEETSDDQIVAWLTAEAKAPTPEPETKPAIPDGHIVVPEARLRDLEVGAKAGVEAAEKLRQQERTEFLDSVRDKYAPANRAAWEAEYDRDPNGTRTHFASAPSIIPINQLGAAGSLDLDSESAEYERIYGKEVAV